MHKIISIMAIAAVSSVATMLIAQNFSSCQELVDRVKQKVMSKSSHDKNCTRCSCCSEKCNSHLADTQISEE